MRESNQNLQISPKERGEIHDTLIEAEIPEALRLEQKKEKQAAKAEKRTREAGPVARKQKPTTEDILQKTYAALEQVASEEDKQETKQRALEMYENTIKNNLGGRTIDVISAFINIGTFYKKLSRDFPKKYEEQKGLVLYKINQMLERGKSNQLLIKEYENLLTVMLHDVLTNKFDGLLQTLQNTQPQRHKRLEKAFKQLKIIDTPLDKQDLNASYKELYKAHQIQQLDGTFGSDYQKLEHEFKKIFDQEMDMAQIADPATKKNLEDQSRKLYENTRKGIFNIEELSALLAALQQGKQQFFKQARERLKSGVKLRRIKNRENRKKLKGKKTELKGKIKQRNIIPGEIDDFIEEYKRAV